MQKPLQLQGSIFGHAPSLQRWGYLINMWRRYIINERCKNSWIRIQTRAIIEICFVTKRYFTVRSAFGRHSLPHIFVTCTYIYINPSFSLNVVGTTQPQYEVKLCFSAGRSDRIASYGWISGTSLASQQVSCLRLFLISLKDSWEPTNKWELWLLNSLVVYNLYCWPISHRNYILINNT